MGRLNRFVQPDVVRLEISEGDWIEIKAQLNVGERKRMFAQSLKRVGGKVGEDAEYELDPMIYSFATVEAYLVGWSFAEEVMGNGDKPVTKPVELTSEAIQNLDETTFAEIQEVITKHTEKIDTGKKATGGKRKSAKT